MEPGRRAGPPPPKWSPALSLEDMDKSGIATAVLSLIAIAGVVYYLIGFGPIPGVSYTGLHLFICGVVRHGGYDPPTLLTALVPRRPPTSASWSGGDR